MRTKRTSRLPPIYTQVIGSLPRPQVVRDLLSRRGELPADRFQRVLDDFIVFAIRLQEQVGLDVISDGEWRRSHYIGEFLSRVGGFEKCRRYEHHGETKLADVVVRPMAAADSVFAADAKFLVEHTDCTSGEAIHDERLRREWNVDRQFPLALAAINTVAENLPAEVHLHCCHSVYKRQSDVIGDYKPILPRLAAAKVDRVNLEFAYPQTGDVSDLELLPDHLGVGMGVVDVRTAEVQTVEAIEALGAAGARIVSPSRIALNPDCGFAPGAGEPPTIDEAYEKLSQLVAAAKRLRGRFATEQG
jgi:methionine synthase II (cobalamin-independent)